MKMDISTFTGKAKLVLKKHSPEILVFLGIGGAVTGAVMACKATRKLDDVLFDHKERVKTAKKQDPDNKKELTKAYAHTGVQLVKLYGPSVTVGALSVSSILAGNNILRKRNVALVAAYAAVDQGFKDYRGRVVERFGAETDNELRHNLHKEKIDETVEDCYHDYHACVCCSQLQEG